MSAKDSESQNLANRANNIQSLFMNSIRISNDKGKSSSTASASATYTTPHDEVLAELYGLNDPAKDAQGTSPKFESTGIQPKDHTSSAMEQPTMGLPSSDVLLDPFDGTNLGVLMPYDQGFDSQNPSQVNLVNDLESGLGSMNTNPVGNDALWSQLSRVLDIQSDLSRMHLEMESIGLRTGSGDWKGKGQQWKGHPKTAAEKGGTSQFDSSMASRPNRRRQRAMSTVSTISSGEPEVDESGINFHDEEEEKTRIRGEEFAKLSSQFEGRKAAINGIMLKLDELSKTLSEFHPLPIPNIEISPSPDNSLGFTSPTVIDSADEKEGAHRSIKKSSSPSISKHVEDSKNASVSSPPSRPPHHQLVQRGSQRKKPRDLWISSSVELGKHPRVTESPVDEV